MKKLILLLIAIPILAGLFFPVAYAGEIKLIVKNFQCTEEDKIIVEYGLINTFGFEYNNVTLGFKLVEEGKSIACNQTKVIVPKGADGTEIKELTITVPCAGKNLNLETAAFYYVKKYKIDEWFSDCN